MALLLARCGRPERVLGEVDCGSMQLMAGLNVERLITAATIERLLRMTLVSTIYAGTSEIQREIISKTYGL